MKFSKILICVSAFLALTKNDNWAWFFAAGLLAGGIDFFYSNNTAENKDNENSKGGGAMGW